MPHPIWCGMASPCIDVCRYDETTGFCFGCGLMKREKTRWKKDREDRPAIRAALRDRLAELAAGGHRTGEAAKKKK